MAVGSTVRIGEAGPRRAATPPPRSAGGPEPRAPAEAGALTLEFGLALPLLFLSVFVALHALVVARDVLVVHEAARAGARAAATSVGPGAVDAAVREAAGGLPVSVAVTPPGRAPGDLARVRVSLSDRVGPIPFEVSAEAVARVEPGAAP